MSNNTNDLNPGHVLNIYIKLLIWKREEKPCDTVNLTKPSVQSKCVPFSIQISLIYQEKLSVKWCQILSDTSSGKMQIDSVGGRINHNTFLAIAGQKCSGRKLFI